jgi:monoamine oxidase
LGGRTKSVVINDCTFDEGAEFIGATQHHVVELAHESKNELVPVNCKGKKVIEFKDEIGTYTSNIPKKVNILALINLQWGIWKINRMAKKVPTLNPRDCEMGYQWDSITLKGWLDQNLYFTKLKVMVEAAIRVILGV